MVWLSSGSFQGGLVDELSCGGGSFGGLRKNCCIFVCLFLDAARERLVFCCFLGGVLVFLIGCFTICGRCRLYMAKLLRICWSLSFWRTCDCCLWDDFLSFR